MDDIISHSLPLRDFQQGIDLVTEGAKSLKVALKP
jgi:hypothetical protein